MGLPDPDSDDERFSYKPDLKVYPDYTKLEDWTPWFRKVKNLLCTHGLEKILDAGYEPDPLNPKSVKKWVRKQRFVYTMLEQRVLILTSRRIVQKYDDTMDGRQALLDLADQARRSTEAVLSGRHTREKIGQARYDPRSGSALQFITKFEETMEKYNLQQRNPGMVLTGPMMKSYIQAALVGVMMLRGVTNREHDRMIQGVAQSTRMRNTLKRSKVQHRYVTKGQAEGDPSTSLWHPKVTMLRAKLRNTSSTLQTGEPQVLP